MPAAEAEAAGTAAGVVVVGTEAVAGTGAAGEDTAGGIAVVAAVALQRLVAVDTWVGRVKVLAV